MFQKEVQKKNYYFFETVKRELKKFDVVSFGIFDVLLLRNVLFPSDVFRQTAEWATAKYGINGFDYVRANVENESRLNSGVEDIALDEIYEEIHRRYPEWPTDELKTVERELEVQQCCVNPLIKQLYDEACVQGKKIWLISDTCLSSEIIATLLSKNGYNEYHRLYVSNEVGKTKKSGNLYQHILDETGLLPERWLHIGCNGYADAAVARQFGITAAYYQCPRECFLQEPDREKEKTANHFQPEAESLQYSREMARQINTEYTKMKAPDTEVVIQAEQVSMMFNMNNEKVDNLKEYVVRFLKRQLMFQEFWALKDVSFCVRRGEKVGLIGLNGSGKSTMLKVVSGVMKPTKGKVFVKGSVAPLIELGAGFDFELSARENVYLNGAILGLSKEEMDRYYQGIIDFSELHDFQDIAIKNFSSGMIARLGFAIATCRAPDVLIIDEILSVGDFAFQQKCRKRMEELTGEGVTVLFVSHSAEDIMSMCDRAIWLDHGELIAEGEATYVVNRYLERQRAK